MTRDERNVHNQTTPHLDGKREGVINDPEGKMMGVRTDSLKKENVFHVTNLKNEEMKEFQQLMQGNPENNKKQNPD